MRYNKSAQDLEKIVLKIYNIQTLWQQSCSLDITSRINSLARLKQSEKSLLINSKSSILFLSQIFYNCLFLFLQ